MAQLHTFVPWALYIALQVLARRSPGLSEDGVGATTQPPTPHSLTPVTVNRLPHQRHDSSGVRMTETADDALVNAQALDLMHFLQSALANLKNTNALAQVFETAIAQEMSVDSDTMGEQLVGLVEFPLTSHNR